MRNGFQGSLDLDGRAKNFDALIVEVKKCTRCKRMLKSERIFGHASGLIDAPVMFIGEAPGRLGADVSMIPFHGDKAGANFEALLEQAGISRYEAFVTNAVLCNPRDSAGNNASPTPEEIANCSNFLRRQLELVNPKVVVTLGSTALRAASLVENHQISLGTSVGTDQRWFGRTLVPLYHPGQRATIHRSFLNQLSDFRGVAKKLSRHQSGRRSGGRSSSTKALAVARRIVELKGQLSYFALHKLFFLVELEAVAKLGRRISDSYIIRQKDGPYSVDLHVKQIRKALPMIHISQNGARLILSAQPQIFGEPDTSLSLAERDLVQAVVDRFGKLPDMKLKTRVYLSKEMRRVLRLEKYHHRNMENAPLLYG